MNMYEYERKKLSRAEFDKLDLQDKIDYLSETDLWECIASDYNILRCDEESEIEEEIEHYISYSYSSLSWRELLGELNKIRDLLDNLHPDDWIYKDTSYGPTDFRELTIEKFNEIVDIYKETETYNETFTVLNFDGAECHTASTMHKVSEMTPEPFAKEAKAEFVKNLGWLLSQTRAGVSRCEYIPTHELVRVYFDDGFSIKVNVEADSWMSIIKDVLKNL